MVFLKKYFLDCGCNIGQSTEYFINKGVIDRETEVHLFDPNPNCIQRANENLSKYSEYNLTFHTVALWNENCQRNLTLEVCPDDYSCQLNNIIIELKDNPNIGGPSNIMEDDWNKPKYIADHLIENFGLVHCIDFAEFIRNLNFPAKILCKMDLEGAEYKILDHLIETKILDTLSELYIEWHNHLLKSNHDNNYYINQIKNRRIVLHEWI